LLSTPDVPSFLECLYQGSFRWDLLQQFPQENDADRAAGDESVKKLNALLSSRLDPDWVEANKRFPAGFLDDLKAERFHRIAVSPELGGLGLSPYSLFRLVEGACAWSVPVGLVMAIEAAVGICAYLPTLQEGPLREYVCRRIRDDAFSATASTETIGAANSHRETMAIPTEDGSGYLISGNKIHIGNGAIAEVLCVVATVKGSDKEETRLFFMDSASPGIRIGSQHEFMGIKGFPNSRIILNNVYVPKGHMFVEPPTDLEYRISQQVTKMLAAGRLHLIAAPSLALSRRCLAWSRDFLARRKINGRPLGEYDAIQRLMTASLADVFAIETVAQWCLLADRQERPVNPMFEQMSAKNISSVAAWRVVDRTMSLFAGEGFETAASKSERQAAALPLERAFRDARNFRISGGVDFQIDNWTAQYSILSYYYPEPVPLEDDSVGLPGPDETGLTARNHGHLRAVAAEVHRFREECLRLSQAYPDPLELRQRENILIGLSEIGNELLTMSLVLARASHLSKQGHPEPQALADAYCFAARQRVGSGWRKLAEGDEPDFAGCTAWWLDGSQFDFLLGGAASGPRDRVDG
jgi:alkylation response protein AidB-like acyl-CoA dehydrogenase